jgi:hypothetical protein
VLFGDQAIEPQVDSDARGRAEAFQTTGLITGTLSSMNVFVDNSSTATKLYIGLYTNAAGHPGTLLAQGSITTITRGTWNTVPVSTASISSGTTYWIAILGTSSGTPFFRDRANGSCKSEISRQTNLTSLPSTWSTGTVYNDCPLSAYGQ